MRHIRRQNVTEWQSSYWEKRKNIRSWDQNMSHAQRRKQHQ